MNITPSFIFKDEPDLGGVADLTLTFCQLSKSSPISRIEQITGDICGHMFSKLCGFVFKSKATNMQYRTFMIVYTPKKRNNHIRNERSLSGWYCWKHIGKDNEMIISKADMLNVFGFNVDKFFQSDVFIKALPGFQKQSTEAMESVVSDFINALPTVYDKKNAMMYYRSVMDSIHDMSNVTKTDFMSGQKKAKLAYNADDTYQLTQANESKNHGFPEYSFNTIGDLDNFLNMAYSENDMTDRDRIVIKDLNGLEHKIVNAYVENNGVNFVID